MGTMAALVALINNSKLKCQQPWNAVLGLLGLTTMAELTNRLRFPQKIISNSESEMLVRCGFNDLSSSVDSTYMMKPLQ